jgi:PEP-CTERM motif
MKKAHHFAHQNNGVARSLLTTILSSTAIFCGANVATAGVVSIYANDGTGWALVATDPTGVYAENDSFITSNGAFRFTKAQASMSNGPLADLSSTTVLLQHINIGPGGGTSTDNLQIAMVSSGYTNPITPPTVYVGSQVSGSTSGGTLTYLDFQSYVASGTFTDPTTISGGIGLQVPVVPADGALGSSLNATINSGLTDPYSVAQLFNLTMTGNGEVVSLASDTSLSSLPGPPVPEPSSISLVCICLMGFSGYSWRRRRQQTQASAMGQAEVVSRSLARACLVNRVTKGGK